MRIVGGRWKGRSIEAPAGRGRTRPTTDRTREALASMVLSARGLDLSGASVLDAFAGSGAIGLELVSRGAARATLVDESRSALACARRNARSLGANATEVVVVGGDVLRLAANARPLPGAPFDVVVLDPPYALAASSVTDLVVALAESGQLVDDALVVYEHDAASRGLDVGRVERAEVVRLRRHGVAACELTRIGGRTCEHP